MPAYTSRGLRLHYEDVGDGPAVLLIHGFTNHGLVWAPQLPALVHAGFRALLPDLAGHGRSAPAAAETTPHDLAADMVALLDAAGVERAVAVGLSLGGMVAQELALGQPDRVRALVVADSAARFDRDRDAATVAAWVAVLAGQDGPRKRLSSAWPSLATAAFRASPAGLAAYAAWEMALEGVSGTSLARVARGMLRFDAAPRLPGLRLPALVVVGEADRLMPTEASREIAALIPGARLTTIPGAGHLANLDRPDAFDAALLGLLAEAGG